MRQHMNGIDRALQDAQTVRVRSTVSKLKQQSALGHVAECGRIVRSEPYKKACKGCTDL
jgi:hypothetical protein